MCFRVIYFRMYVLWMFISVGFLRSLDWLIIIRVGNLEGLLG